MRRPVYMYMYKERHEIELCVGYGDMTFMATLYLTYNTLTHIHCINVWHNITA